MQSITTSELRTLLAGDFQGRLIDVREPAEHALARIPGAELMPLGTFAQRIASLPREAEIYIHCKSGMRSARAVGLLLSHGFSRVKNVTGGIDAWLQEEGGK